MNRFDPKRVLPPKPFVTGMATALDIYGASGLRMYGRIYNHWITVTSQPKPSAEDSIRESVARINGEYLQLLTDHTD